VTGPAALSVSVRGPWRHVWPMLVLLLLFVSFYSPYMIAARSFPYDFQGPHYALISRNALFNANGETPLWLPQFWGGMSHCAIPETGLYYPFHKLLYAGGDAFSIKRFVWYSLAHILFGAIGAYRLTRSFGCDRFSSVFGGVFFLGCGYLCGHLQHSTIVFQFAWFPWIFTSLIRSYRRDWVRHALAAGIMLGVCGLAGSYVVYFAVIGASMLIVLRALLSRGNWRTILGQSLARIAILGAGYVIISAAVILPALEAGGQYIRGSYDEWFYRLDLRGFGQILFPQMGYLGDPTLDQTMFIGVVPLLLATFAVRGRYRAWPIVLICIAAIFFVLGFQSSTFIGRWASRALPGYKSIRGVMNAWGVTQLALLPLIALGVGRILQSTESDLSSRWRRHAIIVAALLAFLVVVQAAFGTEQAIALVRTQSTLAAAFLLAAFAVGALAAAHRVGSVRRRFAGILLLLVFFIELATTNSNIPGVNTDSRSLDAPRRRALAAESTEPMGAGGPYRFDLYSPKLSGHPLAGFLSLYSETTEGLWGWESGDMIPRLAYVLQGLASNFAPQFEKLLSLRHIRPGDYPQFHDTGSAAALRRRFDLPAYRLFGVRYVIDNRPWEQFTLPGAPRPVSTTRIGEAIYYELPDPLPRAFLVDEAITHEREGDLLRAVIAEDFDPSKVVHLFDTVDGQSTSAPAAVAGPFDGTRVVSINDYKADRIKLSVATDRPRWLFISNAYWPGWRATVDGVIEPIRRANFAFQAIPIAPGAHEVMIEYAPRSLAIGCWATYAGGLFLLVVWGAISCRDLIRGARRSAA